MCEPIAYRITVRGHLDSTWADWFEGLTIDNQENGEGFLSGHLTDQAALYAVLNRLGNLGLTLISVHPVSE